MIQSSLLVPPIPEQFPRVSRRSTPRLLGTGQSIIFTALLCSLIVRLLETFQFKREIDVSVLLVNVFAHNLKNNTLQ